MSNGFEEYSNSSINETFIYDFEDFDSMDHVNVLAYLVMSIRKYEFFNNTSKKEGKITTVTNIFLLKIILSAPLSHKKTVWRALRCPQDVGRDKD